MFALTQYSLTKLMTHKIVLYNLLKRLGKLR